ncbi:hypothetical protein V500_02322 [Pseudogymnoascus sp. VKM F-4518 (FW-2643)]|nr:hypothetical protein V500_02322 [Pseudogymnoascus sp. VKM F-4518 (FW-2643)]
MATDDPHSYVEKLQNEIDRLKSEVQRLEQPRICARCCQFAPPLFDASRDDTIGCSNAFRAVETRKDDTISSSTVEAFHDDTIGGSNVFQVVETCNDDTISSSTVEASHDDTIGGSNGLQTVQAPKNDTIGFSNDHQASETLQFIQYSPVRRDLRVSTSTKQTPSRKYADELSHKILSTDISASTNCVDNYCVHRIRAILRGVSTFNTSSSPRPSAEDPWQALRTFSGIIKGTEDAKKAIGKIHAFQQLIFVSACVVLKSDGVDDPLIDDAIRLCASKSKVSKSKVSKSKVSKSKVSKSKVSNTADTYAFEKCPQWIGEQISKWGDLATEYMFQSGMSIYKYSVMADNPKSSAARIIERIVSAEVAPASIQAALAAALSETALELSATTAGAVSKAAPEAECIPLDFPVFVEVVLDGYYPLDFICDKLTIGASYVTPQKKSLYEKYIAIRDRRELKCQKRKWDDLHKGSISNRSHAQPRDLHDPGPEMELTDDIMDTSSHSSGYTPNHDVEQHSYSNASDGHGTSDGLEADNYPKFEALVKAAGQASARSSSAIPETDSKSIGIDHLKATQESLHQTEYLAGSAQLSSNTDIDCLTSPPLHESTEQQNAGPALNPYWDDMSGSYWDDMSEDMSYWGSMTTDPNWQALRDSYRNAVFDSGLARRE